MPRPFFYLAIAVILFAGLGSAELWTQESRWGAIIQEMMLRHDYLHPYLISSPYYDKPLLSYWLTIALTPLTGGLNEWSLRLPSALSALLILSCCYTLIRDNINRQAAQLCVWILLSTFYFVFWARNTSADMLNIAGIVAAVTWYYRYRLTARLPQYGVFFTIVAVTCLLKGIVAAIVIGLIIFPDLLIAGTFKRHCRWSVLLGLLWAAFIYILPFLLSNWHSGTYDESGLYQVFRENIVRYFHPYDQVKPFYWYFLYLPIYTLPWAVLLPFMIVDFYKRFQSLNDFTRWIIWASLLVFLFFTCSGSRRSYYILPLIPFVSMLYTIWLQDRISRSLRWKKIAIGLLGAGFAVWFGFFIVLKPILYYTSTERALAEEVRTAAIEEAPWQEWQIVRDGSLIRILYYLDPKQPVLSQDAIPSLLAEVSEQKRGIIIVSTLQKASVMKAQLETFIQTHPDKELHVITEKERFWEKNRKRKNIVFLIY